MEHPSSDPRFRISIRRLLVAASKRWWAVIPGGLLGATEVVERVGQTTVSPPTWSIWVVLLAGVTLAVVLAHHDLRVVDAHEIARLRLQLGQATGPQGVADRLDALAHEAKLIHDGVPVDDSDLRLARNAMGTYDDLTGRCQHELRLHAPGFLDYFLVSPPEETLRGMPAADQARLYLKDTEDQLHQISTWLREGKRQP